MSLKAELSTWAAALAAYTSQDFSLALAEFDKIADTSKINWNIGIIHATLGEHERAVDRFATAVGMDGYFTVGYHQMGVSNFMLGRYDAALKDFEDALLYMRGNQTINYEQLGLDFRLYSAEILFNLGLSKIYLGQLESGLADLRQARDQKAVSEHAVIDDAIRDRGADYNVFSVPVGVLFKPAPGKLKNLEARDYMGKAVLVAASDASDAYTTFSGLTRLRRGQTPTGAPLDVSHPLSRSASISTLPQAGDPTPVLTRLYRSNTVAAPRLAPVVPVTSPASVSSLPDRPGARPPTGARAPGLSRALTTSVPQSVRESSADNFRDGPPTIGLKLDTVNLRLSTPRKNSADSTSSNDNVMNKIGRGILNASPEPFLRTPPTDPVHRGKSLRVTDLYDDYYKSAGAYDEEIPPDLPSIGGKKIEAWTKKTAAGPPPSTLSVTIGGATAGAGLSRGLSVTSRGTQGHVWAGSGRAESRNGSRMESRYEDETSETGSFYDMAKIRVKVHATGHTRGMSLLPTDNHATFISALSSKFPELSATGTIAVRFRDEDGDMLSLVDEGDYEAAVDVARVMAKGRTEGKLEIWVD